MADSAFLQSLLTTVSKAWSQAFNTPLQARQAGQALDMALTNAGFGFAPVGSIMAWDPSMYSSLVLVPTGWQQCDGSLITDTASPFVGKNTPNLNGTTGSNNGYFLRGANNTYGTTQADAVVAHTHSVTDPTHQHTETTFTGVATQTGPASATGLGTSVSNFTAKTALASTGITVGAVSGATTATETRPINYGVVWIMRIK